MATLLSSISSEIRREVSSEVLTLRPRVTSTKVAKLFTTAYFPPVSYFAAMAEDMSGLISRRGDGSSFELSPSVVYIEACENFQKQSYRNRCRFYGAEGVQTLSFPIIHEGGTHKIPISEVKVDYSTPWLIQHQRAIISAYRTSAYFEYYQDELFEQVIAYVESKIYEPLTIAEICQQFSLIVDLTGEQAMRCQTRF